MIYLVSFGGLFIIYSVIISAIPLNNEMFSFAEFYRLSHIHDFSLLSRSQHFEPKNNGTYHLISDFVDKFQRVIALPFNL